MKKRIAALFDIDGTLERDSLLISHYKNMVKSGLIDHTNTTSDWLERQWQNRDGDYEDYLNFVVEVYKDLITGCKYSTVLQTSEQTILDCYKRLYGYTRDRIAWHRQQGHLVVFISGSPDFLVGPLADKLGVDLWFATTYLTESRTFPAEDVYTGEVVPMWDSASKQTTITLLQKEFSVDLENSYAYGDTTGDYAMLASVGNPVAVNPNAKLFNKLKERFLSEGEDSLIAVERKDLAYTFKISDQVTVQATTPLHERCTALDNQRAKEKHQCDMRGRFMKWSG